MDDATQSLGQRIVEAARLAVAMHLADALIHDDARQRVVVGGADQGLVMEDVLLNDRVGRLKRSFPFADGAAE